MKQVNKFILTTITLLLCVNLYAQRNFKNESVNMPMISASFGFNVPGGDLADRFGEHFTIGGAFHYKLKSNFLLGFEGNYISGNKVYEPGLLSGLMSENEEIFDKQAQIATVLIQMRGSSYSLNVGKILPVLNRNPNSGLLVKVGVGFMQHKIRVEHQNNRIPQLEGNYLKGYDKLTNGLMLNQFIGYMNMSNSKLANFYAGFEISEGFTKCRRDFNFDTRMKDEKSRLDLMFGIKVGWCLPIYKRMALDYYTE